MHGINFEKEAIKVYQILTKNKVTFPKKLFVCSKYPWIKGKVDGIVNNDTILEVKCPLRDPCPNFWILKKHWDQCQRYMYLLDFQKTHFVEYYRKYDDDVYLRWKTIRRSPFWIEEAIIKKNKKDEGIARKTLQERQTGI